MSTLFKGKYENLRNYENLEDIIGYFEEVLDIVEKVEIPSEQQLTEIEETFQELADQYWHNYPKKISGKIKIRLETYINKYFYYSEDNFIFTILTLKLDGCYPWIKDLIRFKVWESNIEKLHFQKQFNKVLSEKDYPWNND